MRTSLPKEKNRAWLFLVRLLTTVVLLVFLYALGAALVYWTIPMRNTQRTSFDTIIVLGCPANPNGTASPDEQQRVEEGVREFRAGVAPRLIITGGAAHNHYVEAHVMAEVAAREGVPAADVFEERQAQDTIQNAYYSVRMMEAHGWHSAEVVSEPSHLRRASLIFSHFPVQWRMHASHWPAVHSDWWIAHRYYREILSTDRLRLFGFRQSRFFPSN